jgi:hypothetical protein
LELSQYIYLCSKRKELELIALRHHAVHRRRVNIQALQRWASDASIFAALLGDSTAAAQFEPLAKYLETQHHRIDADEES